MNKRSVAVSVFLAVVAAPLIYAQDLSRYREFQLGMNLPVLAKHAGLRPSEARVIYQRPAVIQELDWRPVRSSYSSAAADPVDELRFSFCNGELYRIVVRYDPDRTEGLTEADIIEGISVQYGRPSTPVAKIISSSPTQVYSDSEKVIARWEDSEYSFSLFRFSYQSAFGMLVFSKRLDALAQVAILEAIRLNEQEAPQREIERQKKQDDEARAAEQKVRPVNKANFRP